MLDKSLPYIDILMHRKAGKPMRSANLLEGFRFAMFKAGDELDWAEIETSVLEFDRSVEALDYFQRKYLPYLPELQRRCVFIETEDGYKVATATIWWGYTGVRRDPWLHWIAVRPEYQGKGLGKAVVNYVMKLLVAIEGDRDAYLHTQTWSYKAVNIYRQAGFEITDEKGLGGYSNENYEKAMAFISPYLK